MVLGCDLYRSMTSWGIRVYRKRGPICVNMLFWGPHMLNVGQRDSPSPTSNVHNLRHSSHCHHNFILLLPCFSSKFSGFSPNCSLTHTLNLDAIFCDRPHLTFSLTELFLYVFTSKCGPKAMSSSRRSSSSSRFHEVNKKKSEE